jgi:Thioesterase superfamily
MIGLLCFALAVLALPFKSKLRLGGVAVGWPLAWPRNRFGLDHPQSRRDARATFPDIGVIDLRIDYLRPGRGHYFVARGRLVRLGERTPACRKSNPSITGQLQCRVSLAHADRFLTSSSLRRDARRHRSRVSPRGNASVSTKRCRHFRNISWRL